MKIEIKIPEVGESVQEALLAQWYKHSGDIVHEDEVLFVIETDKVTLEISAKADGKLTILVPEGETVAIGTIVGIIETEVTSPRPEPEAPSPPPKPVTEPHVEDISPPKMGPSVRRLVAERGLDPSNITGTAPGNRITKGDVLLHLEESEVEPQKAPSDKGLERQTLVKEVRKARGEESISRKPMSPIRQRIAERLITAKQNTAMLTTFNEIDMSRVQTIRARFKESCKEKYGVSLGIMSFFIKASVEALKQYPEVNAFIEGGEIVYHHYYHIAIAVAGERGLVAPVIRHADLLSFAELEMAILDFVARIRENRLELSELEGGTFTISNGGIFGSLLSTPILNTPQSGILGMHKIEDRPVAIEGQVVIRPMMYVALSYDHRIVDGREAVSFLKRVKECLEYPERIMLEL